MRTQWKLWSRAVCGAALVLVAVSAARGAETGFVDRVYRDAAGAHKYVVFVPHAYRADKEWPTILFLHGAGERGSDGQRQVQVGLGPAVRMHALSFPFITVFPQVEDLEGAVTRGWLPDGPDGKRALAILSDVEKSYRTDKNRTYLTGISMGGFGTWAHAAADPDRWAAIAPICGGGEPSWAPKLAQLPIWCFHGADDRAVPAQRSREMIHAITQAGGHPKYTEYPNTEHNSWDKAYGTDELYTWLLKQQRGQDKAAARAVHHFTAATTQATQYGPVRPYAQPPGGQAGAAQEPPFIPAVAVPDALYVRLGRDMLAALADSLPFIAPREALSGRLPDMSQVTSESGYTFNVTMSGITYSAQLTRALIEPVDNGQLSVALYLRNVNVVLGQTYVSGSGRSAVVGPVRIVLGTRRDLPLEFVVQPMANRGRLQFRLISSRFRIPSDNWTVGWPASVQVSGLGMTEGRVSSSLVSGISGDPSRIENQVRSAIPTMLGQLEQFLNMSQATDAVAGLWPLPVYHPRVRSWPAAVSGDRDGLTIVLGISAAALGGDRPQRPEVVELSGVDASRVEHTAGFQFGLAPEVMEPLSAQVVSAGVARVLVADMPMRKLQPLGDPDTLASIVADLKRRGDRDIRAEFVLASPLRLKPGGGDAKDLLEFQIPKAILAIAVPSADGRWAPYVNIEFQLSQMAKPDMVDPTPSTRALSLDWQGDAEIEVSAHFAEGYKPGDEKVDTDRVREILAAGWREWTEFGPLARVPLPDVDLGFARFRADTVQWQNAYLATSFAPAGVVIRNLAGKSVAYETRSLYSDWGGPYTVDQDQEHRYNLATPVVCRFYGNDQTKPVKVYTLPPGSQFEFQADSEGNVDLYQTYEAPPVSASGEALEAPVR